MTVFLLPRLPAGASFEVLCLGRWWDSLGRAQWPPGQEAAITEDFEVTLERAPTQPFNLTKGPPPPRLM